MVIAGKDECGLALPLLSSSDGARLRSCGVENGLVCMIDWIGGVCIELLLDMTKRRIGS